LNPRPREGPPIRSLWGPVVVGGGFGASDLCTKLGAKFVVSKVEAVQKLIDMRWRVRLPPRTPPRLIEIPRERGGGKVHYTEEQLAAMRSGRTVEEYRRETVGEMAHKKCRRG
jgi:hypothetical protein